MTHIERRRNGARRAGEIANEKSLDDMYRCIFSWDNGQQIDPRQADADDMDDDSSEGDS